MSPQLNRRTTLKDALALLLDADVQAGVVLDRHDGLVSVVTVDEIAAWMRARQAGDGQRQDGRNGTGPSIGEAATSADERAEAPAGT
jgi:hypothetical protein